ncbi:MAG: LysR family transcriptional regulator [Xanthobacteraceae bacterium]
MQTRPERGVPILEHKEAVPPASRADWEAIHTFLEVARRGSFRSASDHLGLSLNSLRRQISELERQLGVTLFTRHVDGVRMTPEGEEILEAARKMEVASFGVIRARDSSVPALAGEVRLAVTEGIGTFWLIPRLVEFQRTYPGLLVHLTCAMRSVDVLRLEADVAVQLTKPTNPDLKVVKLGRLHIMPFAGQSYIDTFGSPKTLEEMRKHRLVLQFADQTTTPELYEKLFPGVPLQGFVSMCTNVSSGLLWAIAKGAGIGWLPTYVHAIAARIVPVDAVINFPFDIWLTYHPDAVRIRRVRRTIDWLIDAFDPKRFPWFRDEFIHPNDLPKEYQGTPLVNMFEGFFGPDSNLPPANDSATSKIYRLER